MTDGKKHNPQILAVLTGDIVGSTKLEADRRLFLYKTFPVLSALLKEKYPEEISYRISNFRGDGWQIIVNHPKKAFEISLFIRTFIRFTFRTEKLDTRIAIGIGPIQFIPDDNVSAGDGPAYTISGRLLESFTSNCMGIGFTAARSELSAKSVESMVTLLDHIITSWGPGQCQAVFLALQSLTQAEIAGRWTPRPIKQSSVSKSLKTAGWEQVKLGISAFEDLVNSAINYNGE
ncbi:MAG: hypothetical protein C0401_03820 [Anaerolinea sp.]|nr:hypothetical protein [Anaerolinea sp.]